MKTVHNGDQGDTSLVGKKVSKDDPRVEAYGTIDELNSAIGLVKSLSEDAKIKTFIKKVQQDLFVVGAELSNVTEKGSTYKVTADDVSFLENFSDEIEKEIKPLNKFVLPGGSKVSSSSHLARSICRRAERKIVTLSKNENVNPEIIRYVNRLSDVLFIIARYSNQKLNVEETTWGPDNLLGI